MPSILSRLDPQSVVSRRDRYQGLVWVTRNGVASQGMETLTLGVFLVAYALSLGASNFYIGLLAAVPQLAQVAQLPGVLIVERFRKRRLICFIAGGLSRPLLLAMAAAALLPTPQPALAVMLAAFFVRYLLGGIVATAWNCWMRDLVPQERMGRFFANRLAIMTAAGVLLSLVAAGFIDVWTRWLGHEDRYAYALLIVGAFLWGVASVYCFTRIPEPVMVDDGQRQNYRALLSGPFKDPNFRRLLLFLLSWNFAVNLAAPFFAVSMLRELRLDLTTITGLTVLSQIANILVLKKWGTIADRFSNKSVLTVCGPLFIFCIFAWTFTSHPERHALTIPLLVLIHVLTGIATAGVTLASGNIGLKLAPQGKATAYLAASSLATALAAGIAPIIGGLCADLFVDRELAMAFHWASPEGEMTMEAINLRGWDFFFAAAAVIGLYSLHRLALVREIGEVEERIVLQELLLDAKRTVRNLSTVAGLRSATEFPLEMLRRQVRRRQHGKVDEAAEQEHRERMRLILENP